MDPSAAPGSAAASRDGALLPGGLLEEPVRGAAAALGVLATLLGLGLYRSTTTVPSSALTLWVVSGLGVPLLLVALRPRRLVLGLALAVLLVPLGMRTAELVDRAGPPQEAGHDGGVHITGAAAEDLLDSSNPYTSDFSDDLPPSWSVLRVVPGEDTPNPVVDHMPYLPGAFLVAVPGAALERAAGLGGDPRWVMGAIVIGALIAVARRPEPVWARAATIFAFGSSFVLIYAAWGTNDAAAAALVVLAALAAVRHPAWAGAALALAISYKAPLVLALVPWSLWIVRRGGRAALWRWWSLPAVLAATTLPFLLWSPSAFLDDTLGFWTGRGSNAFPASGLGLGYRLPDLMSGPVGVVITVGVLALGLALAVALVLRYDHPAILPVAGAVVLLGLFVPAQTFQPNYLALVTGMLAAGWLVVGDRLGEADPDPAPSEVAPTPT